MTSDSLGDPLLSSTSNDENIQNGEVVTDAVQKEKEKDFDAGENHRDDEDRIARVVINPSMIDRFWNRDYYYFYDDISVPYEALLIRAESPLLPSQQEKLFLAAAAATEAGMSGSSDKNQKFGHLWMQLCARLAKNRAEFYKKQRFRFFGMGILWIAFVGFLLWQLVYNEAGYCDYCVDDYPPTFLLVLLPLALNLYPLTIRAIDVTDAQVQHVVDDMAPMFSEEGFYVDLITSSPMFVRFQKAPSSSSSSSSSKDSDSSLSLKRTMTAFQIRALGDYQESLVAKRQEQLKKNRQPATFLGIRATTLMAWKSCIERLTIFLGIWCLFGTFMIMTSWDTVYSNVRVQTAEVYYIIAS